MKKISIIVPVHNEESNIQILHSKLVDTLRLTDYEFEIIFINDGSKDKTQEVLEALSNKNKNTKYIELSTNFGHQNAVKAGIDFADGDAVISMDGDLQHPPELIPDILKKWEEGYEVVNTVREYSKKTSYFKRITSDLFYKILSYLSDIDFKNGGGSDFRLLDKKVVYELRRLQEIDLFLRGLTFWIGFKQTNIHFVASDRYSGKSSYTLKKMVTFALIGITSFSTKPLYLATILGSILSCFSVVTYILYVLYTIISEVNISGWASMILTIVFFGGLQLVIMGIMGIYIGKIFTQVKGRPTYIIRNTSFNK